MSTTPDKCPHCGAGEYPDSSPRFHTRSAGKLPWLCGTLRDTVNPVRTGRCFENELINERAAHAATKRELENTKANLDLAEISITTMKAKIESLQQQLVAKQPTEKPSSRFDGEYDTEYHQGFNGHGY